MKLHRTLVLCLAIAGVMTAADSPFIGKWKLNLDKSKLTGQTSTYESLPGGEMKSTSGGQSYNFKMDGKEYPTAFGNTAAWKEVDAHTWQVTWKMNGKVEAVDTMHLSADGKTMTIDTKGTKPNGDAINDSATLTRESGGPGLAGKWKSTKVNTSADHWDISANGADGLTFKLVDYNATASMKFDGKDYDVVGPTVPKGYTLGGKQAGPRRIEITEKMAGKPVGMDVFTVSADGKTMTDEYVAAGTNEKMTSIYERQ